ncbi:hypothetical protein X777_02510 [Ooceraea biroi]|uniref:Uncharacterized protein n=1 Tax=Ooceraea biroi TaxID=2015173 RepID=A0A026WQ73_OOCBI|nr:hypothetical protein X777_02510 [Ooceraea biroi]
MTGEDGKRGGGAGDVTTEANVNTNVTNNANVNANISVSQQNGGPEKAPVVGGSNVETLPRAGKQGPIYGATEYLKTQGVNRARAFVADRYVERASMQNDHYDELWSADCCDSKVTVTLGRRLLRR